MCAYMDVSRVRVAVGSRRQAEGVTAACGVVGRIVEGAPAPGGSSGAVKESNGPDILHD